VQVTYVLADTSLKDWSQPLAQIALADAKGQRYFASQSCGNSDTIPSILAGNSGTVSVFYEVPKNSKLIVEWQQDAVTVQKLNLP
jgi:hypothetical protein